MDQDQGEEELSDDAAAARSASIRSSRYREDPANTNRKMRPILALMVLVNLSWSLYQLPLNRVIERRLCQEYYAEYDPSVIDPSGTVDETLCKVDPVQQGLGWIQGVMESTWVVGDFIMTIPLVCLVDRYGPRPVLWLNLVPRVAMLAWTFAVGYFEQALPIKAIMAAPFLSVLGGDCVFNSIIYALTAGLTDDYVLRATYFSQMNAISSIFAFQLGPALASATMSILLWLPFWLGIVILLVAAVVIRASPCFLLLGGAAGASYPGGEQTPLLSSPLLKADDSKASMFHVVRSRLRTLTTTVAAQPRNFGLLLFCFLLTSLASSDTKLLTQYISKRYGWTFASVGYLLSVKAVFNFIYLTLVVPEILRRRKRARSTAASTAAGASVDEDNIRYANICIVLSVFGSLAIGLSWSIWLLVFALLLYALGIALPIFTYSLLNSPSILPGGSRGAAGGTSGSEVQVFSIVMLVKTAGLLLGAPLMATLWVKGIGLGGAALGLPFFVSSAGYLCAFIVLSGIVL